MFHNAFGEKVKDVIETLENAEKGLKFYVKKQQFLTQDHLSIRAIDVLVALVKENKEEVKFAIRHYPVFVVYCRTLKRILF